MDSLEKNVGLMLERKWLQGERLCVSWKKMKDVHGNVIAMLASYLLESCRLSVALIVSEICMASRVAQSG